MGWWGSLRYLPLESGVKYSLTPNYEAWRTYLNWWHHIKSLPYLNNKQMDSNWPLLSMTEVNSWNKDIKKGKANSLIKPILLLSKNTFTNKKQKHWPLMWYLWKIDRPSCSCNCILEDSRLVLMARRTGSTALL